jgi:hypothetical protein
MGKDDILRELEICLWKHMSKDPKSTTFQDVDEKTDTLIWECKYNCDGVKTGCLAYKPLKNYPKLSYIKEIWRRYYNTRSSFHDITPCDYDPLLGEDTKRKQKKNEQINKKRLSL